MVRCTYAKIDFYASFVALWHFGTFEHYSCENQKVIYIKTCQTKCQSAKVGFQTLLTFPVFTVADTLKYIRCIQKPLYRSGGYWRH